MTFTFPQNAYGNPQRPYRLVSSEGQLLGQFEATPANTLRDIVQIRYTLVELYNFLHDKLPEGCPMIVGGGFVRDSVLGGSIGDIDIWIPRQTNLSVADVLDMKGLRNPQVIFELNAQAITENMQANAAVEDYRDLSNLFVVDGSLGGIKINFIKSMTEWTVPEAFFRQMFHNFDTEISMFFIGFIPEGGEHRRISLYSEFDQAGISTLIIPHSYREIASEGDIQEIIAINPGRVSITSPQRMEGRYNKLISRYNVRRDDLMAYTMGEQDFQPIRILISEFDRTLLPLMPTPRLQPQGQYAWPNMAGISDRELQSLRAADMTHFLNTAYTQQVYRTANTTRVQLAMFGNTPMNPISYILGVDEF